jgi:hypothetical protein
MSHESDAWIDEALRALVVDDERVSVPAGVQGAVLREWDQHRALGKAGGARDRGARLAWVVVPAAAAAALLTVAVLQRESAPLAAPDAALAPDADLVYVPPIPDSLSQQLWAATAVASPLEGPAPPPAAADASPGYVIVPGPLVDPGALHVVRARMSRMALASLGMPIVNPDIDGLVEVEMLVGDDGVAQSIRHATLVSD